MYDIDTIYEAADVRDAIAALQADPEAVVICGGSDVLIKIREGKLAGCRLVSIHALPELSGVTLREDGTIIIGPANTFAQVKRDPIIAAHIPALGDAVDQAGGPQLRGIGTIGGNICNGVTSADSAPMLLALNGLLEITGPNGVRYVAQEDFYAGPGRVHMAHGELLTAVHIRRDDYAGYGGHYIKYAQRNAMDIATLGCAVNLRFADDGHTLADYRLAYGVAAPTPVRCHRAEEAAIGRVLDGALLEEISEMALGEVSPRTSWRATKAYRLQLVRELAKRATIQAAQNAGGDVA